MNGAKVAMVQMGDWSILFAMLSLPGPPLCGRDCSLRHLIASMSTV